MKAHLGKIIEEVYVSGVIQFFNKERGFGFINRIGDDGRKDYFFHFSEIQGGTDNILRAIKYSLLVIFDIGVTPGGRREAVHIKIFDTRLYLEDLRTCSVDCPCRDSKLNVKTSRTYRKMVC
ncbi:hypothetical protein M8J76_014974 [Diaphorina citri]|nr:hypothetical protein M8J76_014974 [Diaphorina citri]KAI5742276.1 hypothetical protein M8J77_005500 [Diaphorina citri]